jgi:pyruvate carboxylase
VGGTPVRSRRPRRPRFFLSEHSSAPPHGKLEKDVASKIKAEIGRDPSNDEVLSYLMCPEIFLKFAQARQSCGDVEVVPTPQFFCGMETGEEIGVGIEHGKTLIVKFLAVSRWLPKISSPKSSRTYFSNALACPSHGPAVCQ